MHVVWFAEIKWSYLRTRKQQLIRRRPSDIDLVFFEPYVRGRENRFDLREADGIRVATVPFVKAVPRGPLRALLDLAPARRLVDAAARRRARAHLRAAGIRAEEATFVVSNVYAVRVARSLRPRRLVYDCNDAHAEFPGMPAWTRDYQDETFRAADAVVVSAVGLFDDAIRVRGGESGIHMVGNGVDFSAFRRAVESMPARERGTVRIGYVGAIAPWFDFDLVTAVARAHGGWRFTLVGPVLPGAEGDVARLAALDNVEVRPAVPHEDVPMVLGEFTVGMIPFRLTPLTASVNPNKLYEYLAAGLPVVSTPFSRDVNPDPDVVALADGADAFAGACARFAAARGERGARETAERRALEIAAAHDWDRMAADFWARVRDGQAGP